MDISELERKLGYVFSNRVLLETALTHRTWLKEKQDHGLDLDRQDQQRLEFLGDAFLGYTLGRHLFEHFPQFREGDLTATRRSLVRGTHIHQVGERLDLVAVLRLGRGEIARLDRNKKVIEDTVEAIIGAVLLDASEVDARDVVLRLFLAEADLAHVEVNPISDYNQRWQRERRESPPKPTYTSTGLDDARMWWATVLLPDGSTAQGEGGSRRAARGNACARALEEWCDLDRTSQTGG